MNINTRDMSFIKFNGEEMQWVKVNGVTVYEAWKRLTAQGPVPLVLMKSNGTDLVDYKIFGNSKPEAPRLPQEYQEIEYLQNSGAQYIDTGIIPDNSTGVEIVYKALDYATSQYIAGARVGWSGSINYGVNGSGSRTEWDIRFNSVVIYSSIQRTDHKMKTKIILNNGNGAWNLEDLETGEKFDTAVTNAAVSATTNLMLFAYSDSNIHKKLRIYSCKVYSGEELVKDFVPCYRKSDDARGMYDLINGVFHEGILKSTTVHISKGNHVGLELESVGEKITEPTEDEPFGKYKVPVTIKGPNYFNPYWIGVGENYGVTAEIDNGNIILNGWQDDRRYFKENVAYIEAGRYTFNTSIIDGELVNDLRLGLYKSNEQGSLLSSCGTFATVNMSNKNDTQVLDIEAGYYMVVMLYKNSAEPRYINTVINIKMEKETPIKTNIYLNEPLRKLGDYADEINYAQGKIIRRVGHYTYTGLEEGWLKNATTTDGYAAYRIEGLFEPLIGAPNDTTYMTHFNYTTKGATADFVPGEFRFAFSGNNIGSNRVYMATVDKTLEEFIVWVTDTRPTIYYPIADTPEEINLPAIPTLEKTTILQIDTTIQPDHIEVVYIGK